MRYDQPMKLAIIGLLRPKMNRLSEYGQLAHLTEHLLANHERLERNGWPRRWHADRIVTQNAYVNNHFGVEFAVVPTNRATEMLDILRRSATNFDFTDEEIERDRRIIVEELAAEKTAELTRGEQFERSCFTNPVTRRSWDDRELRHPLQRKRVLIAAQKIAGEHYPFIITQNEINFSDARLPYLRQSVYQNFAGRARELWHPKANQGRCTVLMTIPCPLEEQRNLAQHLLGQLLRNHYFGYLTEVLRHREGQLYSLSLGNSTHTATYDISFMADRPRIRERANYVLDLIGSDECVEWIRNNLALAKRARVMMSELAWMNPADFAASEINHTVMTGDTLPMDEYLRVIKEVTVDEVIAARDKLMARRDEIRLIIGAHGPKVRSTWSRGLA